MTNIENVHNGVIFKNEDIPGKTYFLDTEKFEIKECTIEGGIEIIEDSSPSIDQSVILDVIKEMLHLKRKSIGGGICQMIESWGGEEKIQNARKCLMWRELDRHI